MASYDNTLRFLRELELFGIKAGLRNIESLLSFLGQPQKSYPAVHIAGTNGKGSTASMLAAMLTASGYRTGLYTSPHLVRYSERMRIDGLKIPEDYLVSCAGSLRPAIERVKATFFEATTAIAFKYFQESRVDLAVIETGLGGRLDATNVITPLLSLITNIGLEHTQYLGRTHRAIAAEKAGIIKPFVPCITGTLHRGAYRTLARIAASKKSPIFHCDDLARAVQTEDSIRGLVADLRTPLRRYLRIQLSLAGLHQLLNLKLAVLGAEYLSAESGFSRLNERAVRKGLSNVRKFSGLRGRLDILSGSPLIVADVAHNPDGAEMLASSVRRYLPGGGVLLFGLMKDKPCAGMVGKLRGITRIAVCVTPDTPRALKGGIIAGHFHAAGRKALDGGDVAGGLEIALAELRRGEPLIITGSHYLVGEVLNFFNIFP